MGVLRGARYDDGVRRYFTTRCIGLHLLLIVLLPAFAWLTRWQLDRAEGGNSLSWAYVILWPCFGVYAIYTWWQLIHDQTARVPGRRTSGWPAKEAAKPGSPEAAEQAALPPGWALTGGRKKNVAIAASAPIDPVKGGRGERYTAQTPEEAERLAAYNRYLASLSAEDEDAGQDEDAEAESGSRSR
jgi:hypothetical protein